MSDWLVWALLAVAAVLVAALYFRGGDRVARRGDTRSVVLPPRAPTEGYSSFVGASRTYAQPAVPKPGDLSPLTPALLKAVDSLVPARNGTGEALPFDDTEVRHLMQRVLERVNRGAPELDLQLVEVSNVRKAVDSYKTLLYEADLDVYSKGRAFGSRVAAQVDVDSKGKVFVRALKVHQATAEAGRGVSPSNGPGFEEAYARFDPVAKYPF